MNSLIYAEIHDRRASTEGDGRGDVLSLLMNARHEDGRPMSDDELRDELMTLLTAGHETTATGLSRAFERLVRTRRVLARLLDSLDEDEYVEAVVKEPLRVRPVAVDVGRKLTRDTEVARLAQGDAATGVVKPYRRRSPTIGPVPPDDRGIRGSIDPEILQTILGARSRTRFRGTAPAGAASSPSRSPLTAPRLPQCPAVALRQSSTTLRGLSGPAGDYAPSRSRIMRCTSAPSARPLVSRITAPRIAPSGYRLPAGTIVLPAIAAMHARPDLHLPPREFRPERFLDGRSESYAWIPFGGGVCRCIGASFAATEMKVVLREVLRRVRLRAASRRPERGRTRHVTVVPSREARVIVEERFAEPAASEPMPVADAVSPG